MKWLPTDVFLTFAKMVHLIHSHRRVGRGTTTVHVCLCKNSLYAHKWSLTAYLPKRQYNFALFFALCRVLLVNRAIWFWFGGAMFLLFRGSDEVLHMFLRVTMTGHHIETSLWYNYLSSTTPYKLKTQIICN